MATLLLKLVRSNAELVGRQVGAGGAPPADWREVSFACSQIAESLEELLGEVEDSLKEGVGGARLRAAAKDYLASVESTLPMFALVLHAARSAGRQSEGGKIEEAGRRARKVRDSLTDLLAWAGSPPPHVEPEALEKAQGSGGAYEQVDSIIRRLGGE
jgi:hypothetical protein